MDEAIACGLGRHCDSALQSQGFVASEPLAVVGMSHAAECSMALHDERLAESPPPNLIVLTGSAHPALGAAVAAELGLRLGRCRVDRYPDGELDVEVDGHEVAGADIAIVQPTVSGPHGRDSLLELMLIADACSRAGALAMFAVVPYFGYARQDARRRPGMPLGVHVATRVLATARFEWLITVDPHSDVLAASLEIPLDAISAAPLIAHAIQPDFPEGPHDLVVVAPDLGAVKLAREYARRLRAPIAVVHKLRTSGRAVVAEAISGDVRERRPLIVDDMISTGGTLAAAANALRAAGSHEEITVAATHGLLTPGAMDCLREANVRRLYLTDSVPSQKPDSRATVVAIAPLLSTCIRQLTTRRRRAHFVLHP